MPTVLTKARVHKAMEPTQWDFANSILYGLCRKRPHHSNAEDVLAKIWLIGRSYSASIERRKNKEQGVALDANGSFYLDQVLPVIQKSGIDEWLDSLGGIRKVDSASLATVVEAHQNVMNLFRSISGHDNRSLASKYLHFHKPNLFFIYDSQAAKGLVSLSNLLPRASHSIGQGDNTYRKFAEKCIHLREYIAANFSGATLTPREIDKLLLALAKARRNEA